ncbi:MAG: DUF3791 domain-containing protein [Elusimicrobiota bacterium]|jgi:hypothetical protein|nr:DUF3791 domain-containing protein [Elusimicrobiota bacterium]
MKKDLNADKLSFAVFVIENAAERLKKDGAEVYDLLTKKTNLLHSYIIPNYEALHTQGKDYIINEIIEKLKASGARL